MILPERLRFYFLYYKDGQFAGFTLRACYQLKAGPQESGSDSPLLSESTVSSPLFPQRKKSPFSIEGWKP